MTYDVQDFETDVIEASRKGPVVVDFWAEWCGPCRILGPILEKLAEGSGDRWRLAKVDTEAFPEEASRYGVRGIPNVKLFVDGSPVDEFVGALPEHLVREWLERVIPSDADREAARALKEAGELEWSERFEAAADTLESALSSAPDHPELKLELARIVVFDDPARARRLLERLAVEGKDQDLAEAVLHLADILDRTRDADVSEAPEGPETVGTRHREAVERLRTRDFVGAFEKLLEVLRADGGTARESARRTCTALFRILGADHPLIARFRSEVASALYR